MHFGIGDVVNTWSDIQAWSVNASIDVTESLRFYAAYWNYTEQETLVAGESDDLGSEIDLIATYKYNNAVSLEAGYARYMPGDGRVDPTADPVAGTPDDARDWAYLQITANF
jgi:predicted porin